MSRSHGRILARIWSDTDFLVLAPDPQRMYLFLLSQPDLNHAGLIPLRVRRWAASAATLTLEDVQRALKVLDVARFVLVDEDTEEALIRTLVRNDGIYKQPKVMIRMGQDARLIASQRLRLAFAEEMRRLPLGELSGTQRLQAEAVVSSLVAEFDPGGSGSETDLDTLPKGYPDRLGDVDGLSPSSTSNALSGRGHGPTSPQVDTLPKGYREGSGIPSACVHAHSPSPQPPSPSPQAPTLLTLVGRLAGSDARAREDARLPDEVIQAWQRIAGPDVDLETEAAAYFAKQGGRPARDEAAAWAGWLKQAARHAARARGTKPIGCKSCITGWLPEPDDPEFPSATPCPACRPRPSGAGT
jgi:hypothetical protein